MAPGFSVSMRRLHSHRGVSTLSDYIREPDRTMNARMTNCEQERGIV